MYMYMYMYEDFFLTSFSIGLALDQTAQAKVDRSCTSTQHQQLMSRDGKAHLEPNQEVMPQFSKDLKLKIIHKHY